MPNIYQGPGMLYSTRDMQQTNPFTSTLARLTQENADAQSQQNLAAMAAERMRALGPQGEQWAAMIQRDPRAALAMMEQYGGPAEIENSILGSRAAGEAQAAIGQMQQSGASPQEIVGYILRTQGPKAAQAAAEALKGGGPTIRSGPNQRLLEIRTGPDGRPIASEIPGQPAPIVAGAGPGGLDLVSGRFLRNKYETGSKDFIVQRQFYDAAVAAADQAAKDPKSPGAVDFALVQAYGKMLDPNSVVRNEEGQFIVESQSSVVQDKINAFTKLFSSAGTLNPTARFNLMKQIEAQYRQAEARHLKFLGEMDAELSELEAVGVPKSIASPIGIGPSDLSLNLAPWEAAARGAAEPPTMEALMSMPIGATFTDTEGTWRKTDRTDPNGEPIFEEVE